MTQYNENFFADVDRLRIASPTAIGSGIKVNACFPNKKEGAKRRRINGEFLLGPIPLRWLAIAASQSGKAAIVVAMAVWFEQGRRQQSEIKLTTKIMHRFTKSKNLKARGLVALEKAGLIRITRRGKKNPLITILELPATTGVEADTLDSDEGYTSGDRESNGH